MNVLKGAADLYSTRQCWVGETGRHQQNRKYTTYDNSARGNTHQKFGEVRTHGLWAMLANRPADRPTRRQTDRQTRLSQYSCKESTHLTSWNESGPT